MVLIGVSKVLEFKECNVFCCIFIDICCSFVLMQEWETASYPEGCQVTQIQQNIFPFFLCSPASVQMGYKGRSPLKGGFQSAPISWLMSAISPTSSNVWLHLRAASQMINTDFKLHLTIGSLYHCSCIFTYPAHDLIWCNVWGRQVWLEWNGLEGPNWDLCWAWFGLWAGGFQLLFYLNLYFCLCFIDVFVNCPGIYSNEG